MNGAGIKKFLASIFTEDDAGTIFDFVRVLAIAGGVVLIGLAIYQAVGDLAHFDLEHVGRSFMEYFGGVGAMVYGKAKGEK